MSQVVKISLALTVLLLPRIVPYRTEAIWLISMRVDISVSLPLPSGVKTEGAQSRIVDTSVGCIVRDSSCTRMS